MRATGFGVTFMLLLGCAAPDDQPPVTSGLDPALFNGTAPEGFGDVTFVTLAAGTYPRATSFDSSQDDLVIAGGDFPVRRVAQDRVRIGFSGMLVEQLDDTAVIQDVRLFTTEPTVRVGGTEDVLEAVLAVLSFCGEPFPDAAALYAWGDEPVTRAEDTGEFQFTQLC